jgi:hypothetical protein
VKRTAYGPVPKYLLEMPAKTLFGACHDLETWLREHGKQRPTLLDLARARAARGTRRGGKSRR